MPGETLIDGLFFPESPRWNACEQNWYFSDILNQRIHRMDSSGQINLTIETPDLVSGLGWLPNNDLVAVLMNEHRIIRFEHNIMSLNDASVK